MKVTNRQLDFNEIRKLNKCPCLLHHPVESDAPVIAICLHQPRAKPKLCILHHTPPLLTTREVFVQVSPGDLSASAGGHLHTFQPAMIISIGPHTLALGDNPFFT